MTKTHSTEKMTMYKFGQLVTAIEHNDSWLKAGHEYMVLDYYKESQDVNLIRIDKQTRIPIGVQTRAPAKYVTLSSPMAQSGFQMAVPEPGPLTINSTPKKLTAEDSDNPKTRYGLAKPPIALIPMTALVEEACTFRLGAKKYGPANWREKAVPASVYVNAALRHILSWYDGQDLDPESGASHLAHARACMAILIDAASCDKLIDDRPSAGKGPDLCAERTQPIT
jgi:hypothetical protein